MQTDFDQATIRILPKLPDFQQASGHLDLIENDLTIRLDAANAGLARMENGLAEINFANPEWLTINISGDVQGPLGPSLPWPMGGLGWIACTHCPLKTMAGQGTGRLGLTLGFNPFTVGDQGILSENNGLNTRSTIADLQVPDYLLGGGISNGSLDLTITDQTLTGQEGCAWMGLRQMWKLIKPLTIPLPCASLPPRPRCLRKRQACSSQGLNNFGRQQPRTL